MAGPGSGLGSFVGTGIEAAGSYGTFVTINKWHAVDSIEIEQNPTYVEGSGLRGGTLVKDANDRVLTNLDAAGPIKMPVYYNGMGRWLGSLMGSLATAPVVNGATASYTQTHAFANTWQQSISIEQGILSVDQTTRWWRNFGCKVTDAQFDCTVGQALMAQFTVDAQDRFENSTGTTPTEPTANPFFAFHQMAVKIGAYGSEVKVDGVSKWTANYKRAHADKRFNAGNVTTNPNKTYAVKDEPVDNGWADISGTLETEYLNDSLFETYYQSETPFSLIVAFTSATLAATGYPYSISFNFPRCYFTKGDPKVTGPDIIKPSMPFKVYLDETHPASTIVAVNTDVTL